MTDRNPTNIERGLLLVEREQVESELEVMSAHLDQIAGWLNHPYELEDDHLPMLQGIPELVGEYLKLYSRRNELYDLLFPLKEKNEAN